MRFEDDKQQETSQLTPVPSPLSCSIRVSSTPLSVSSSSSPGSFSFEDEHEQQHEDQYQSNQRQQPCRLFQLVYRKRQQTISILLPFLLEVRPSGLASSSFGIVLAVHLRSHLPLFSLRRKNKTPQQQSFAFHIHMVEPLPLGNVEQVQRMVEEPSYREALCYAAGDRTVCPNYLHFRSKTPSQLGASYSRCIIHTYGQGMGWTLQECRQRVLFQRLPQVLCRHT